MVSRTNGTHFKASSTRDSLSKLKSFFKKSKDENNKQVNTSSATGVKSVVFHDTRPLSKVEQVTTAQPKDKCSMKNKFKSFFSIKGKDATAPAAVQQRLSGGRRREAMNKIRTFFTEEVVPVFKSSHKKDDMSELVKNKLTVINMDHDIRLHVEAIKQLTSDIKQVDCCLQGEIAKYNREFNPWILDDMEEQNEKIELLKALLQEKKTERRKQINVLEELMRQQLFLKDKVEEQKEQDYLLEVQRREKYRQRCNQLLKEKEQREQGTELYRWKVYQVKKQTLRPKENQRPIGHYSKMNPWRAHKMLKSDHEEQLSSWYQRYNFLKRTKPSVTLQQLRNGEVSLSERPSWTQLSSEEHERKCFFMRMELQHILNQQRQEISQLRWDTVYYVRAFWNTKTEQVGRFIEESAISKQLTTFGRKLGWYTNRLYHKII